MENISYKLKRSPRARRMRIRVSCEAGVVVVVPQKMPEQLWRKFFLEKLDWVRAALSQVEKFKNRPRMQSSLGEYYSLKDAALTLVSERLQYWNNFYGFIYRRVSIKNQGSLWGSCSKKSNLNFNYKILHLPESLADYLIVHELCHLKEMNHSAAFWSLVHKTIPNYKILRKQLKNIIINK